jgi:RimJ/RimL family protein N-acetyltransferase
MPDGDDVEVAYRLTRPAWGRGIATEAAGALVNHALGALALPRVVAVTYPDNVTSERVLDKLGFERRGFTEYARDLARPHARGVARAGIRPARQAQRARRQMPMDNRISGTFSSMPKDSSRRSAPGST